MFRFLLFLALVFGVYVVLYGMPLVASIDNSLPSSFRPTMVSLHESAWNSLGQFWGQCKVALISMAQAIAAAFHH